MDKAGDNHVQHPEKDRKRPVLDVKDTPRGLEVTDVQWVLGHAHLSTTERYLNPVTEDVITGVLAFHARRRDRGPAAPPAAGYRAESLQVLFGDES